MSVGCSRRSAPETPRRRPHEPEAWRPAAPLGAALLALALGVGCGEGGTSAGNAGPDAAGGSGGGGGGAAGADSGVPVSPSEAPRLFVPRASFETSGAVDWQRSTPFWFGTVGTRDDAVDGRIVWTEEGLLVRAAVFDREIWDEAGPGEDLSQWDSLTLLLDLDGEDDGKSSVDARSWRIDAQARRHGTDRARVLRGTAGAWTDSGLTPGALGASRDPATVALERAYRGEERDQSRGWHVTFFVGWGALSLPGPPAEADRVLRFAMRAFDRDDREGNLRGAEQTLPLALRTDAPPSEWGRIELLSREARSREESGAAAGVTASAYSVASPTPPHRAGTERLVSIREGEGATIVENASVGASERLCSGDDAYNFADGPSSWGNNTGRNYFHVQEQADYADWPCFARAYVRFPLAMLPEGAVILSAHLVLHHKQPTGGGDQGAWSLVHAFHVASELRGTDTLWTEENLTWNCAPLPVENLAATWGDRTGVTDTGWDALPEWRWDVTRAVRRARGGAFVGFALQSSDSEYHTGKEFVRSEDFPDWGDTTQRPRLDVVVADPAGGAGG